MSIDSCYEGVIAKLTKRGKIVDISKKLLSLTNNADRVLYVYELMDELQSFPKVLQIHKSKNVSTHYRNLGNQCFQNSEDSMAWQYYNLSLLHAPLQTEQCALAFSNRSAVFLSMEKHKESLADVNKVLTMKYPGRLKEKLLKRKTVCEQELSNGNNNSASFEKLLLGDILSMKGPGDPRYICASTKLQVVCNDEMGRHVVAKEDIKVGEILAVEDPYLVLLLKSQFLFCCSYCLSRNLNLIPCDKCCFSLYCDDNCKEKAFKEYHEIECPLMASLINMEFTKLELLALRTVIRARTDHDNWSSLFKTIEDAEAEEASEYRGHVKVDNEWIYDSKFYASIHTLASNIEKRSVSDIFQKAVTAAVYVKFLETATGFLESGDDDEREMIRRCVAGTLLHHVMTSPTNMHGISSNMETQEGNFVDELSIASAPYAFHSLLNHSCCPNVVRFCKLGTGQMSLFALRPIKKGSQVFDNYGSHHALEPRFLRQKALKFQYKFDCLCEACVNNWPTYLNLPCGNVPSKLSIEKQSLLDPYNICKLQKGDEGKALDLFKPLCRLAESLEPYAPCMELADCQESLKQCLAISVGLVPYEYSKVVDWKAIPPTV